MDTLASKPSPSGSMPGGIRLERGRGPSKRWRLDPGVMRWVIGRGHDSDLVLDDPAVSRQHAELLRKDGALWLYDLGSKNGVLVDGARADGQRVDIGVVIGIGDCLLRAVAD